jgi:phosphatidylserine decarboxylase
MTIGNHLFVLLQHLLPKRLITALIYRIARIESPGFKNALIRHFVRLYSVYTAEAVVPAGGYRSFNDFFTRALKPGARIVDLAPFAIASPCDGTVAERGELDADQVLQAQLTAKRRTYSLGAFLGDIDRAAPYIGGQFATIYLAPYNYHRVHVPLEGTLVGLHYEPGLLYSVNMTTAALVDALYVKNERLVCHFVGPSGPYALVFVGALNVGSVSLTGIGEVLPRADRRPGPLPLPERRDYGRGDELGWFNMGSTVVLIFPPKSLEFVDHFTRGSVVQMGERIAMRHPS